MPDELVDEVALCGPRGAHRASGIEAWKESPITTMIVGTVQPDALELLAELTL